MIPGVIQRFLFVLCLVCVSFAQAAAGAQAFARSPSSFASTDDGNGNVSEVLDDTGAIVAHYQYDAFGNEVVKSGLAADWNKFRFSTKWTECTHLWLDEYDYTADYSPGLVTDKALCYYGYRYYEPGTGRWLSRDPIGEPGGLNLYGFGPNGPTNGYDRLGLDWYNNWSDFKSVIVEGTVEGFQLVGKNYKKAGMDVIEAPGKIGETIGEEVGDYIYNRKEFDKRWIEREQLFEALVHDPLYRKEVYDSICSEVGESAKDGSLFATGAVDGALTLLGVGALKQLDRINDLIKKGKIPAPGYAGRVIPDTVCFVAGTRIATEGGSKPIEQVEVGDRVWALDEETGERSLRSVSYVFEKNTEEICEVAVEGETIETTPEHPFWVVGTGWMPAAELERGVSLSTRNGSAIQVFGVNIRKQNTKVFNFEVEGLHTYFVSSAEILVHNRCRITPMTERIVYREPKLFRDTIDSRKPFNQALSDQQPILGIRAPDGSLHIMQGNHRVRAAVEDGVDIEMNIFTPDQWKTNFGFEPSTGGWPTPPIVPGRR